MARRTNVKGTVYILHFTAPYGHARHYTGWTERKVETRFQEHLKGQGSPLVAAAVGAGIEVQLAMTIKDTTRFDERRIKNCKKVQKVCPTCGGHGRVPVSRATQAS